MNDRINLKTKIPEGFKIYFKNGLHIWIIANRITIFIDGCSIQFTSCLYGYYQLTTCNSFVLANIDKIVWSQYLNDDFVYTTIYDMSINQELKEK